MEFAILSAATLAASGIDTAAVSLMPRSAMEELERIGGFLESIQILLRLLYARTKSDVSAETG